MPAYRAGFFLNTSGKLRPLAEEARRLNDLNQMLSQSLPAAFAPCVSVKRCRAGVLILLAENAAVATKLKQLAPRLLTSYRKLGVEVTSIRIEVQVNPTRVEVVPQSKKEALPIENIKYLKNLADRLPNSPLKAAVAAMVARHTKK